MIPQIDFSMWKVCQSLIRLALSKATFASQNKFLRLSADAKHQLMRQRGYWKKPVKRKLSSTFASPNQRSAHILGTGKVEKKCRYASRLYLLRKTFSRMPTDNKCCNSTHRSLAGAIFHPLSWKRQIFHVCGRNNLFCLQDIWALSGLQTLVSPSRHILTETGEHFYWHVSRTQVGLFSLPNQGARNKTQRSARRQTRSADTCLEAQFRRLPSEIENKSRGKINGELKRDGCGGASHPPEWTLEAAVRERKANNWAIHARFATHQLVVPT